MRSNRIPQQARCSVSTPPLPPIHKMSPITQSSQTSARPESFSSHREIVEFIKFSNDARIMKKDRGFTLIELMITVAIVAIVASIAFPSFQKLIQDQRTIAQANDLLGSIQVARSEAVKRGRNVTFAPATGTAYSNGWITTWVDDGGNAVTLRQHEAAVLIASGPTGALTFNSQGQVSSATAAPFVFLLRPDGCSAGEKRQRTLSISATGRASISGSTCP